MPKTSVKNSWNQMLKKLKLKRKSEASAPVNSDAVQAKARALQPLFSTGSLT
jgi:hypothetical protein